MVGENLLSAVISLDPPYSTTITRDMIHSLTHRFFLQTTTGSAVGSVRGTSMDQLVKFLAQYQKDPTEINDFWIFQDITLPPDGSDFKYTFRHQTFY